MPAGVSAWTPLANLTLGSAAASVTFSSISSAYRDLVLVANVSVTSAGNSFQLRFNGDTTASYSYVSAEGNGTSAGGTSGTSNAFVMNSWAGSLNGTLSVMKVEILDYSSTDKHKSLLGRGDNSSKNTGMNAARWANTAAINSIYCFAGGDNFSAGSTFALYGVSS